MLLLNEYKYLTFAVLFLQLPKRRCNAAQHASKFGNYYHTYIFNSQLFLWNATNIMNSYHYGWRSNQSRGMWYLFANKSKLKYLKMRKILIFFHGNWIISHHPMYVQNILHYIYYHLYSFFIFICETVSLFILIYCFMLSMEGRWGGDLVPVTVHIVLEFRALCGFHWITFLYYVYMFSTIKEHFHILVFFF